MIERGHPRADLGLERDLPDGWRELFERRGPGDPRLPDPQRDRYPPMNELLDEVRRIRQLQLTFESAAAASG